MRDKFARGIQGFGIQNRAQELRNPAKAWNPESTFHWKRLESSTRNPQSTEWDPESKTVLYSLTWGNSTELRRGSYYLRAREQFSKCGGRSTSFEVKLGVVGGGGGCGVVDFKNGSPDADTIFFNTVTTHQSFFFNSLTNEKGISNKKV